MNFSSKSQPSPPHNYSSFQHGQSSQSADDPLNSIRMSIADFSIGSGYSSMQHQDYNSVVQGIARVPSASSSHGSTQLNEFIGAAGESLNWTSSNNSGLVFFLLDSV